MSEDSILEWPQSADVPALPRIGAPLRQAMALAAVLFGGFGAWSALTPLESAATAPGFVRVESHHRTIQHLEGGIVRQILVHDGDHVRKGQILVRLSSVESQAALDALKDQDMMLKAELARLAAERDGLAAIRFPPALLPPRAGAKGREIVATQQSLFEARRAELETGIGELEAEIAGHRAQIGGLKSQIALYDKEIRDVSGLVDKGLATRPRLSALQRELSAAEGEQGAELAAIAHAQQAISDLKDKRASEVQAEKADAEQKLAEVESKLQSAGDVNARTLVKAPSAGQVVNLHVFTPGGVIAPGQAIVDIVPDSDPHIIEAHVRPQDIDAVHAGLPARVVLTAYKRAITPTLDAKVTRVSADALMTQNHTEYYSAELLVDAKELARANEKLTLYPGMPVEVMIVTGKRTLLDYLLEPLTDAFRKAFREP